MQRGASDGETDAKGHRQQGEISGGGGGEGSKGKVA